MGQTTTNTAVMITPVSVRMGFLAN
jgi:hypothetical protein